MRVALDGRTLQERPLGGIGRGLANIIPLLAESVDFEILLDARLPLVDVAWPHRFLSAPFSGRGVLWLQWAAPAALRHFDGIFHCPFYGLPFWQPTGMVVTIHDLTFETHPEWFPRSKRASFRVQGRHAARTAARILTVSQCVRAELLERYGVDETRVLVAPNAVAPTFSPDLDRQTLDSLLRRLGASHPYVVALGGAPRRNTDAAVGAWRGARAEGAPHDLVVVGGNAGPPEEHVAYAGRLDDEAWAALLAGADAFCYSTRYEGFGMPALESLASGTPVVCAPVGALPEVLGDAACWADEPTGEALGRALAGLLVDPTGSARLRDVGLARAGAAPGWDTTAAVVYRAYVEAASDR